VLSSYMNKSKAHSKNHGLYDKTRTEVRVSSVCASRVPEHLRSENPVAPTVAAGSGGDYTLLPFAEIPSLPPLTTSILATIDSTAACNWSMTYCPC
jgi:hypothetical protein